MFWKEKWGIVFFLRVTIFFRLCNGENAELLKSHFSNDSG